MITRSNSRTGEETASLGFRLNTLMRPEVLDFVATPSRLNADAALSLIRAAAARKRNLRLWTSSRLLQRFGVPWHKPERKQLLHRVDHVLRELESRGALVRRPQKQTRRHIRGEWAYCGEWAYELAGPVA
jgi:hypothetical protein